MKLVVQIPCFNEEETLPTTLNDLPRKVPGFDVVEWLIIDDGSQDKTIEIAKKHGVDHIVKLPSNRGLANAFTSGIEASLRLKADVIVNTDADNQYCADDIPALVEPIVLGQADICIGARPISDIDDFSATKKLLQKIGSAVVRKLSRTEVRDAPSGFRAYSREAAKRINVFSEYTYTLETIIQAGQQGLTVTTVPIRVNSKTRESRLVKSIASYVKRSVATLFRIYIIYRPMRFFFGLGTVFVLSGSVLGVRFLYYYFTQLETGKIQSLILAAILIGSGVLMYVVGILSDLLAVNRKLSQDIQRRIRNLEERIQ